MKGWLILYRKHGLEGLYPANRNDKGQSRALSEPVKEFIKDAKAFCPERSAKSIYHELIAKGVISPGSVPLSTLQRFIQKNGLNHAKTEPKDRRAFEMEYPNDCWQTDISTGPYLTINGKKIYLL